MSLVEPATWPVAHRHRCAGRLRAIKADGVDQLPTRIWYPRTGSAFASTLRSWASERPRGHVDRPRIGTTGENCRRRNWRRQARMTRMAMSRRCALVRRARLDYPRGICSSATRDLRRPGYRVQVSHIPARDRWLQRTPIALPAEPGASIAAQACGGLTAVARETCSAGALPVQLYWVVALTTERPSRLRRQSRSCGGSPGEHSGSPSGNIMASRDMAGFRFHAAPILDAAMQQPAWTRSSSPCAGELESRPYRGVLFVGLDDQGRRAPSLNTIAASAIPRPGDHGAPKGRSAATARAPRAACRLQAAGAFLRPRGLVVMAAAEVSGRARKRLRLSASWTRPERCPALPSSTPARRKRATTSWPMAAASSM